jgi:CHASE3 domain sensor protein
MLTPMRLLFGIAALTVCCMFAVALVTDNLADGFLTNSSSIQSARVHLISDVNQALKRAQECRKAYLATGNPSYLDAYHAATSDVDFSMDRLVNEDYEVTSKLAHAQDLRQFVHAKLSEIGKTLEGGASAPAAVAAGDQGDELARIQRLLDSLQEEESRSVSGQIEDARARTLFHERLAIAVGIINFLFLAGVGFCAVQIGRLHSLVTMCAWSKRVHYKDKWVPLEEYMRKRLGVRISHGISEEEFDKWSASELGGNRPADETPENANPRRAPAHSTKAA